MFDIVWSTGVPRHRLSSYGRRAFLWLALRYGTGYRTVWEIRLSAETPSSVHWRRLYFQLTRVHSALELSGQCALQIYLPISTGKMHFHKMLSVTLTLEPTTLKMSSLSCGPGNITVIRFIKISPYSMNYGLWRHARKCPTKSLSDHIWCRCDPNLWPRNLISSSLSTTQHWSGVENSYKRFIRNRAKELLVYDHARQRDQEQNDSETVLMAADE